MTLLAVVRVASAAASLFGLPVIVTGQSAPVLPRLGPNRFHLLSEYLLHNEFTKSRMREVTIFRHDASRYRE